MFIKVETRLCF